MPNSQQDPFWTRDAAGSSYQPTYTSELRELIDVLKRIEMHAEVLTRNHRLHPQVKK